MSGDLDSTTEYTQPDGTGSWRVRIASIDDGVRDMSKAIVDVRMRLDTLERGRWLWAIVAGGWGLSIGTWIGMVVRHG